jgi:hypothetical protein
MEEITMSSVQMLTSYGALGVCTIYFMVKDWVKAKETDKVIADFRDVLAEFTAAAMLCNRNGAIK